MNCREAENLIFAARDGALDETRRATLAEHLSHCSACQAVQAGLAAAAESWQARDAHVPTPAVEKEWHAIRRRIRGEQPTAATATGLARWFRPLVWTLSTAAAAIALALFVSSNAFQSKPAPSGRDAAYVSYVKVFNTADETMVYDDAESGWLVVWVTNHPETSGT